MRQGVRDRVIKRIRTKILLGSITMLMLVGCSNVKNIDPDATSYTVDMDGNKIKIPDDDESLIKLQENAVGYMDAIINIDYNNFNMDKENSYYSSATRERYIASGRDERISQKHINNQLIEKSVSIEVKDSSMFKLNGEESASVVLDVITTIEHATDDFLSGNELKLNANYKRTYTLTFVYEDNNWKISTYEYTSRELVS